MLGIAITTYNRQTHLDRLISEIIERTTGKYHLVVCDDGSTDETAKVCSKHGIARIGEKNMGIAWNKNRGLYALHEKLKCKATIIIEDDMSIKDQNWNRAWFEAALKFGHINFLNEKYAKKRKDRMIGGDGTIENPYVAKFILGPCMAFSRECLDKVGYLHPKFTGYGSEHIELTKRCGRAGFGMKDGGHLHLKEGIDLLDIPSASDKSHVGKNAKTSASLKNLDTWVAPFLFDEQREQLEREVSVID